MSKRILLTVFTLVCLISAKVSYAQIIFDIPYATETYITGINSSAEICGYANFPDGHTTGFVRTATDTLYLVYYANLSASTWAGGLNDNNQVVGRYNSTGAAGDYHCFIYDYGLGQFYDIPDLDGYELTMPNDINNQGWVSGDMKDAAQRRIFTWNPTDGLVTNFVLIGSDVWPTYGGHDIDENGRTSAYYIEGSVYKSAFFQNGFGFTNTIDLPDPSNPLIHKTRLMGGNSTTGLISFFGTKKAYTYDYATEELVQKLTIPHATEIYALDINEEGYIAGYYLDENYAVHGFFQGKTEINFIPSQSGWNFVNDHYWCWNLDDYATIEYFNDPYLLDEHTIPQSFPHTSWDSLAFPPVAFGNWKEFVKAQGESECYNTDGGVGYYEINPNAFLQWEYGIDYKFTGICWGMVSNALLAYDDLSVLEQHYPTTVGLFTDNAPASLDSLTYDINVIPPGRISQMKQYEQRMSEFNIRGYPDPIIKVIPELYNTLTNPQAGTKQLSIQLIGEELHGRHAIMPYKMVHSEDDINLYYIYIYDPNEPLNDERRVEVLFTDTAALYRYDFSGTFTDWASHGLAVGSYLEIFTTPYHLYQPGGPAATRDPAYILTLGNHPDLHLDGGGGGSIEVVEDAYNASLIGGEALFPVNGLSTKPNQFVLSALPFDAVTTAVNGPGFQASSQGTVGTVSYMRQGALEGETDHVINTGDVFSYINDADAAREIDAYILVNDGAMNYQYFCNDIVVVPGQTISLQIIEPTQVMITSDGAATNYDVRIRVYDPETGFWETEAPGIAIGTGVTQILIPDLVDDIFNGVTIQSDADGDGIFESTDDAGNAGIPNMMLSESEFNLAAISATGEFNISNVGGGNLNWNFIETPSWITFTEGATGINHGHVTFTAEDNTGLTRQGWLIAEAAAPANDQDSVFVTQLGTNGVSDLDLAALVSMQPNPAADRVRFVKNGLLQGMPLAYEIFDARGSLVKKGSFTGTTETIETGEWQRGVYTVRFTSDSKTIVRKLVVS